MARIAPAASRFRRQKTLAFAALAFLAALPGAPLATGADASATKPAARVPEPKEWDHLDGRGPSKRKVDVVEWEKNLEIHVYPKGSLKSLGLKLDRQSKTTKNAVLVIEYGFKDVPYTLIRRAMLSIPMNDAFHAFRDDGAPDYDKIIVSSSVLAGLPEFALAPAPTQLYPDHYAGGDGPPAGEKAAEIAPFEQSAPKAAPAAPTVDETPPRKRGKRRRGAETPADADADGAIRNFAF